MRRPRLRAADACVGAGVGAVLLLTGCGGSGPAVQQETTTTRTLDWVPATPTRPADEPGVIDPNTAGRTAAPDGRVWQMTLKPHEAPVEDSQWPDAGQLFSAEELKAVFPDATSIATTDCDQGTWPNGDETAKNTECKIELAMPGDPSTSSIRLRIEGFGADFAMTRRFDEQRATARKTSKSFPDNYTFWQDGSFGAKKIYRDGDVVTVLISDGTVAGQFTLQFSGFNHLVEDDYDASEDAIYSQVMPLMVQTLAAHMPRTR